VTAQHARTRVSLCGPLRLEVDARELAAPLPEGKAKVLLARLLVEREQGAERDDLVDALWPQARPRDPSAALRPLLSRLRRAIDPVTLDGRERVRIVLPQPAWVDLAAAAGAIADARAALREGDDALVAERAAAALGALGDGLLPELDGAWLASPRLQHEDLVLEALELRAGAALRRGGPDLAEAERAGREIVARSPYRESGHHVLMEALAAAGNAAEALRVYDDLRVRLRDGLGAAPAPALQALHGRLLAGAPARSSRPDRPERPAPRSALVGRRAELEALREAWRSARAGERRLVVVAGEPGIGKTRLLTELAREVGGTGTVLHASAQPDGFIAYDVWTQVLRGLGAGDLAPAPDGDPETRRHLLFEAVDELLAAASARDPLLLVLDDLHWADQGTLHLLRHVARSPREPALLVVGTYRSSEVPAGHPLADLLADLRRERLVDRIALGGLDEPEVAELVASEAGRAAARSVAAAVHARTDGNPFFVQEVVRHLVETGGLAERGGVVGGSLRADGIGVPEGVAEVLASRLARLSGPCRDVLAGAAVLGRTFGFRTLAALHDGRDDAVLDAVEEALAAHLVIEVPDVDEPAFAFRHALVREAIHDALSTPRRQRLHAAAARALTAWDDATAHWEGALAVMERVGAPAEERARLLVALASLMFATGDAGRHIAYLRRALALHEELGDEVGAAQVHSRLGTAYAFIDSIHGEHLDVRRAVRHLAAARPVLARERSSRAVGHLENGEAIVRMYALDIPGGLEASARAMAIGEEVGDDVLWSSAALVHGWHAVMAGRLREGFDTLERAFTAADRARHPVAAWMASQTRGQLAWGLGAPDEAQAFFERPRRLAYVGATAERPEIADGIGRCHLSRGELDEARRLASDARPAWVTHALGPLLDLWDGRLDAVARLADRTLETSRRTGNRWDEWAAHHLAARVDLLRGRGEWAIARLDEALAIVVDGGARYFELWVRPDLVRALARAGRIGDAREQLERCQAIVDDGEDWRGRAGHVALAEAAVAAATSGPRAGGVALTVAERIFARYRLVVPELQEGPA
jgi:DNA-binding SARP family transcriptional activator